VPGQDFDSSKLHADFASRIPVVGFDRIMPSWIDAYTFEWIIELDP
jgi:hypothetical protein